MGVGCLSLTDYAAPPPSVSFSRALNLPIKKALSPPFGAPEIVLNIGGETTVGPVCRWILTQARIWVAVSKMRDTREIMGRVTKTRRHSRFSALKRVLEEREWELALDAIVTQTREICFTSDWSVLRKVIIEEWKRHQWAKLALRRPAIYHGLSMIDVKSHCKLLRSMSTYLETTLVRVWAGCPMTRAHRSTIDPLLSPPSVSVLERIRPLSISF